MNSDLTFITNEENQTLKERFEVLIKDTSLFDCLVGYFYSSGFHAIYHSLEDPKKINEFRNTPKQPVWQSRFYDHIIRNESELNKTREYIINNPLNWERDENYTT